MLKEEKKISFISFPKLCGKNPGPPKRRYARRTRLDGNRLKVPRRERKNEFKGDSMIWGFADIGVPSPVPPILCITMVSAIFLAGGWGEYAAMFTEQEVDCAEKNVFPPE